MTFGQILQLPILIAQAIWVASKAARLPEASGSRFGEVGEGPRIRIVVLGDSSAAGVGVEDQSEALGGRLSAELAKRFSVHWQVLAKSGGTVASTLRLLETLPDQKFDFVVIALGVNDVKNGVRYSSWQTKYSKLLKTISDRFDAPIICVSGLPPIEHFPILPSPLRKVLGVRAKKFDTGLRQIASNHAHIVHLPIDFTQNTSEMARDNFHPGPKIYSAWAQRAAQAFFESDVSKE